MSQRILVVDDSKFLRDELVVYLKEIGYSDIVEAEDGRDALSKMDNIKIVITDLNMPIMDGLELVKEARKIYPTVPPYIIMLTTEASMDIMIGALKSGVDNYLVKPFNKNSLEAKLKSAFENII